MTTKGTKNFWQDLQSPFFALAPMYDVTDAAFRRVITKYSQPSCHSRESGNLGPGSEAGTACGPHAVFTEFVSADGLCHPTGREKLMHHLWFDEAERNGGKTKIVAQIFGATPANFSKTARLVSELGFDGVDINMGCPVKNMQKQEACAALINDPELAKDIVLATKDGAGDMPVSVKTRIGYNKIETESWIPHLLETKPAALTVHLRTKKEMSDVPAHWDEMEKIVELAKEADTKILGNGDVTDITDAKAKIEKYHCDGVMLGRAVFGNPWLFNEGYSPTVEERLTVMVEHTKLFAELFTDVKNFAIMKKHYKAYCSEFPEASALRAKLMETNDAKEIEKIVKEFLA